MKRYTDNWSKLEESLIEHVRRHPILYRCEAKSYKHMAVKENKWKEIASKLSLNRRECKTKWKQIRDGYRRNKIHELSGKAARTSKYNDEKLNFLKETIKKNTYSANNDESIKSEYDDEVDQEGLPEDSQMYSVEVVGEQNDTNCEPTATAHSERDMLVEEVRRGREERFELLRVMGSMSMASHGETTTHSFFKSMADVVCQFPLDKIAELRLKVCQIVTDMEMQLLKETGGEDNAKIFDEKTELLEPEIVIK